MSPAHVAKLVAVIIAAFPNAKITLETSKLYERMLGDLEYEPANAAVEQLLATARFPPTIAEIREAVIGLTAGEMMPGGEAWGIALRAIQREGRNRTPGEDFQFQDPVIAQCVAAFNWRELCDSEMPSSDRARFIELYDRLAVQERRRQLSEHLPAMQRFRAYQVQQRLSHPVAANDNTPTAVPLSQILKLLPGNGDGGEGEP